MVRILPPGNPFSPWSELHPKEDAYELKDHGIDYPVIYALCDTESGEEELKYIGHGADFSREIKNYLEDDWWDSFRYFKAPGGRGKREDLERKFIKKFQPPYNTYKK